MSSILPFGTWPSIITAADLASASPRFDGAAYVGDEAWWGEGVPAEGGRTAVFRAGSDTPVLPAPWNARSRVHEYGGGAWTVSPDGTLFFVEGSDQRVYRLTPGAAPVAVTPADDTARFGGLTWQHGRLLAVRERHTGAPVPARDIVDLTDGVTSIVAGSDFVARPALSPDGSQLAWIAWDHPSMPWDAAQLRVGSIVDGSVATWTVLSQTDATGVEWAGESVLFSDDPTGRWNLYVHDGTATRALAPADADTGGALWGLGSRWFAALPDGRVLAVRTNGTDELVLISASGAVTPLNVPLTAEITIADVSGSNVLIFGGSATAPMGLWNLNVDTAHLTAVRGGTSPWDASWLPLPRAVSFDGPHGQVHAFDYPPTNPTVSAPDGERPPYVVLAHGGPTGHVSGGVSATVAYFTSRGIGVLDVNYGGSTGYGRTYRERLVNAWGIVDVDDVLAAASGLAATGAADGARLAVKGGSAGGLTVLGSLVRGGTFAAGISRYGVADLHSLAADTHDFEARYLDNLIGRLPEDEATYRERSPLTHAAQIDVPVLLLQGDQDPVVPPSQSEAVRDALVARGVPHKYVLFAGESHGFRQRSTIIAAAETELAFLGTAFGFVPDAVAPLPLD